DNASRNLFLAAELGRLLDLLELQGIRAIPYKGPVLAASVYGKLSLREAGDLDILIHRRDVLRGRELLLSMGYRPEVELSRRQEAALLRSASEYNFVTADGDIRVEVHWAVAPHFFGLALDLEHVWDRRQPVSLAGMTVYSFSPEDLLLVLCAHGTKH